MLSHLSVAMTRASEGAAASAGSIQAGKLACVSWPERRSITPVLQKGHTQHTPRQYREVLQGGADAVHTGIVQEGVAMGAQPALARNRRQREESGFRV